MSYYYYLLCPKVCLVEGVSRSERWQRTFMIETVSLASYSLRCRQLSWNGTPQFTNARSVILWILLLRVFAYTSNVLNTPKLPITLLSTPNKVRREWSQEVATNVRVEPFTRFNYCRFDKEQERFLIRAVCGCSYPVSDIHDAICSVQSS